MTNLGRELKILLRHGATYGFLEILGRLIGFLMIPIYTHFLTPYDYGVMELVGLTVETIAIVLSFGIADAIYRFYHDKKETENSDRVISTASIGVTTLGLIVVALISPHSKRIAAIVL